MARFSQSNWGYWKSFTTKEAAVKGASAKSKGGWFRW
jgi:hypothetical protein